MFAKTEFHARQIPNLYVYGRALFAMIPPSTVVSNQNQTGSCQAQNLYYMHITVHMIG